MPIKYKRKYPDTKYLSPVGAPKGGRVHWFLMNLPKLVSKKYEVRGTYEKHDYVLVLKECYRGREDMYLIKQTSAHCWSVRYYDRATEFQEQINYGSSDEVIDYILYRMPKKVQQENDYEAERLMNKKKAAQGKTSDTL